MNIIIMIFKRLNSALYGDFDNLTKILMEKDTINKFSLIFKHPKKILSAYIIVGFPETIINLKRKDIKPGTIQYDLYHSAEILVLSISNKVFKNKGDIDDSEYIKHFDLFMKIDKEMKIKELIDQWVYTEDTKILVSKSKEYSDKQRIDTLKVLNDTQQKFLKLLCRFDKFDNKMLQNIYKLRKQIVSTYKKAYWDKLKQELSHNHYNMLFDIITYINQTLDIFNKNGMDLVILKQLIDHDKFNMNNLLFYGEKLYKTIEEIDCEANDGKWQKIKFVDNFADNIVLVLSGLCESLDDLKENIVNHYHMFS